MSLISFLSKPLAAYTVYKINKYSRHADYYQQQIFSTLIKAGCQTVFGKDHHFSTIQNYHDFKQRVPIRDYESFKPYIQRIMDGEKDVIWKGVPLYFSKTSGTVSGVKYIPITCDSMHNHIHTTREAILCYIHQSGNSSFLNGKWIFFSGSPELGKTGNIPLGRLSGIVNHHVPAYLKRNQMPSYKTNCIEDWEKKVDAIVQETLSEKMTLISGIPPWVLMYFEKLNALSGKKIKDLFPYFSLFVYGGVNFEPYRKKFENYFGKKIDTIELYPASEGFIAYQNDRNDSSLLLNVNSGIFYEFIPADRYFDDPPPRLQLNEVVIGVNYALIINSNAGLWGYSIGDTIRFVSKNPYKLVVTGRINHFISAFGEHAIAEEIEKSMLYASERQRTVVNEFTLAPQVSPPEGGLPYHEWFIEFGNEPSDMNKFGDDLNEEMCRLNIYYRDLIKGNILQKLKIKRVTPGGFLSIMKSEGKLGGQNKPPRLSNDRKIAGKLERYVKSI